MISLRIEPLHLSPGEDEKGVSGTSKTLCEAVHTSLRIAHRVNAQIAAGHACGPAQAACDLQPTPLRHERSSRSPHSEGTAQTLPPAGPIALTLAAWVMKIAVIGPLFRLSSVDRSSQCGGAALCVLP